MDDTITINGVEYVRKGKANPKTSKVLDYYYIDIQNFAERLDTSEGKARQIAQRKDLHDRGIAVKVNPDGKAGVKINWIKFVEYLENECPVVEEYAKVKKKLKVAR